MKKVLALVLSLIMVFTVLPMVAFTVSAKTYKDFKYSVEYDGTVKITDYSGSATDLTIPSSIKGKVVKSIAMRAFDSCKTLKSVKIPNSVNNIFASAFNDCAALKSIKIGKGIKNIGDEAFNNTAFYNNSSNWKKGVLYIGDYLIKADTAKLGEEYAVKSGTKVIADAAFYGCNSLKSVTVPNSVVRVGDLAFYNCSKLKNIKISKNLTSIGSLAFENTAFYKNKSNWEKKFLYIDKYLIKANEDLKGDYTVKSGVKVIASEAFENCCYIKNITIPNSVVGIGNSTFAYCVELKSVKIPNSVKSIEDYAFYGCQALNKVTIPASISEIGNKAFGYWYYKSDDDDDDTHELRISGFTIKGYKNSIAQKYATKNEFKFVALKLKTPKMSLKAGKKSFKVTYKKVKDATGFQVKYKTGKGKWKSANFNTKKKVTKTIKKLKKGKTYSVKIRAYIKFGKKFTYSSWTKTKKVKIK